jgi:Transcription factor WhiB
MSDSPPPPPTKSFPCQRDPERWFDRRHRGDTLAQCLTCEARPWCAQHALRCGASWGMWAGVWIDGRHTDAMPYLHAIAADDAARSHRRPAVATATTTPDPPPTAPLRRPSASIPARSVPAAVLARSSGHCEVFAESCRYTFDRVVSRCRSEPATENPSPAQLFAACAVCAEIVACLNPQLATRLGYVVDAGRDPACVPFHWRGFRWVLLDRDGWLTEMREDAQTA